MLLVQFGKEEQQVLWATCMDQASLKGLVCASAQTVPGAGLEAADEPSLPLNLATETAAMCLWSLEACG